MSDLDGKLIPKLWGGEAESSLPNRLQPGVGDSKLFQRDRPQVSCRDVRLKEVGEI